MKGMIAACLAAGVTLAGAAEAAAQMKGYDSFKLVRTRNIFDPSRQPIRTESGPPRPPQPAAATPNQLSLNGTMVTADKSLAFFGGSRNDYRKVAPAGETIAGFKIKSVQPSQVELEREGKVITLPVGQMISPDAAAPTPTAATVPAADTASAAPQIGAAPAAPGAPASGGAPPAAAGAPADRNEILRRMMERRQQETSR